MLTICALISEKFASLLKDARKVSEEFPGLIEKFILAIAAEEHVEL